MSNIGSGFAAGLADTQQEVTTPRPYNFGGFDVQVTPPRYHDNRHTAACERSDQESGLCSHCHKRPALMFWTGGGFTRERDGNCAPCFMEESIEQLVAGFVALDAAWEQVQGADNAERAGLERMNEPRWMPFSTDEMVAEIRQWQEEINA